MNTQRIKTWGFRLAHFLWGLLTGFMSAVNPLLSCFMLSCFIIYELDEERTIKDPAYQEILQFSLGLLSPAVYFLLSSLTL